MQQKQAFELIGAFAEKHNALIVSDIGSQSLWLKHVHDRPENLYLSGPMGMASSVALGVAAAHKDRLTIAACGDGALGMNMTSLCTISHAKPKNLIVIVMNNGIYEFTKSLPTPTQSVDWTKIPETFPGFQKSLSLKELETLSEKDALSGPHFVHTDLEPSEKLPPPLGTKTTAIHERFLNNFKNENTNAKSESSC